MIKAARGRKAVFDFHGLDHNSLRKESQGRNSDQAEANGHGGVLLTGFLLVTCSACCHIEHKTNQHTKYHFKNGTMCLPELMKAIFFNLESLFPSVSSCVKLI